MESPTSPPFVSQIHLHELLCLALETERGGVEVYQQALRAALASPLRELWSVYREQTREHVRILEELLALFEWDAEKVTPGRLAMSLQGKALVQSIERALATGDRPAAQLVASQCVEQAETADHAHWSLLARVAPMVPGERGQALQAACGVVMAQEGQHLHRAQGWSRELWLEALGMPAMIPPPEDLAGVETQLGAAVMQAARGLLP